MEENTKQLPMTPSAAQKSVGASILGPRYCCCIPHRLEAKRIQRQTNEGILCNKWVPVRRHGVSQYRNNPTFPRMSIVMQEVMDHSFYSCFMHHRGFIQMNIHNHFLF